MLSELAVFRSNQRTSLHHNAKCQLLFLMSFIIMLSSMCVIDREIKQCDSYLVSLVLCYIYAGY